MTIGKLRRVELREVWAHEATEFSRWLQENIDALNEALGVEIVNVQRERTAGDFSVDLVGELADTGTVVIENQLERSNHDHLGKLVTYLAALEADAAVWIVKEPRQEHVAAMSWLNDATGTPFYLVQLEAVRIGASDAAPLFTKIVGPSTGSSAVAETRRELAERQVMRRRFWEALLAYANPRTPTHNAVSPGTASWISAGAGLSGLSYRYVVRQHDGRVELYLDTGDDEKTGTLYERLLRDRAAIDEAFGSALDWDQSPDRRACRIAHAFDGGGWRDEERWPQVIETAVAAMIRLESALRPRVKALRGA